MERRNFLLSTAGLIGAGSLGSMAYMEATVSRNVSVRVEADDNAQASLRLQPGPAGGAEIDVSQLAITGEADNQNVTADGEYVFGDSANPSTEYAFSMTNNLTEAREFAVIASTESTDTAIGIDFYDNNGNLLGSSAGADVVSTDTTEVQMETDAYIPNGTGITVTVYEDADQDGTADYTASRDIDDGVNVYGLEELSFENDSDVWIEAEFFPSDDDTVDDPELNQVTIETTQGTELTSVDSAGQIVPLNPGQIAYAVLMITTGPDDSDISGLVEIQSSANEDFS